MRTHDFKKSIVVGAEGETLIKNWLHQNPKVTDVVDVSEDKKYQNQDIDFVVHTSDGGSFTVELKTDTYTSGNIFFETMSNVEHNVKGCMYKSQADFLLYYFTETRELYMLRLEEYRKWFEENISHFKKKAFRNVNRKRDGYYTSEGYTIPKVFLEKSMTTYQCKKVIL